MTMSVRFLRLVSHEKGLEYQPEELSRSPPAALFRASVNSRRRAWPVTLALSLTRAQMTKCERPLMPVANSFKLQDVLEACHYYFEKTGRRLTFEYSLVRGVNDNLDEARALARADQGPARPCEPDPGQPDQGAGLRPVWPEGH